MSIIFGALEMICLWIFLKYLVLIITGVLLVYIIIHGIVSSINESKMKRDRRRRRQNRRR